MADRRDPPIESTQGAGEHQTLKSPSAAELPAHDLAAALARFQVMRDGRNEEMLRALLLTQRQHLLQQVEMNYYLRFIAEKHGYTNDLDADVQRLLQQVQEVPK